MSCRSSRFERYKKNIARYEKLLESAELALEELQTDGFKSATFDTGPTGARQHIEKLDIDKLNANIEFYEGRIEYYEKKLCPGGGLVRLTNRRFN